MTTALSYSRGARLFKTARVCVFSATMVGMLSFAAESESETALFIGARKETSGSVKASVPGKREWFKTGLNDSAFYDEAFSAAKMLAYEKLDAAERAAIQSAIELNKDRCSKAFLWLLDWSKCGDTSARLGAVSGLGICAPDPKVAGKSLATSATFDPDERVRKASAALIKTRKDVVAQKALLATWKSSFDESGVLDANESRRKAAVDAMKAVGEKQVFEVLFYYATLELRAGVAAPANISTVNITGAGINLPIELPSRELINVEGNIAVPGLASLKQATGQDFGHNMGKWREWLSKLP